MKRLISPNVRLFVRVSQRYLNDWRTGNLGKFVNGDRQRIERGASFYPKISLAQPIHATEYSQNKIHNLKLAIGKIENVAIAPGEILSFWHLVGKPDKSRGYLLGRSLIRNEVKANYGGGLCQLSGLLYILALKAGLLIIERHSHSQDIYTEKTRFAPLGSDATVVYGYKDFRLQNSLSVPICFRFEVLPDKISGFLCASEPILDYDIEFIRQHFAEGVRVETVRYHKDIRLSSKVATTIYQNLGN